MLSRASVDVLLSIQRQLLQPVVENKTVGCADNKPVCKIYCDKCLGIPSESTVVRGRFDVTAH